MGGGRSTLIETGLVVLLLCSVTTGGDGGNGGGRRAVIDTTILWGHWLLIFGVLTLVPPTTLTLTVVDDE